MQSWRWGEEALRCNSEQCFHERNDGEAGGAIAAGLDLSIR
jgi:hypothetical protein